MTSSRWDRYLGMTAAMTQTHTGQEFCALGKTQVPVEGGLYVMTHSSTHDKKKMLDKIAIRLGVKLIVEEI